MNLFCQEALVVLTEIALPGINMQQRLRPLMDFLDINLQKLREWLYPVLFHNITERLWTLIAKVSGGGLTLLVRKPGPWFNIKMSTYQYRKSHCGDKTVVRSSYLHSGIFYTGKMISLYWISALNTPGELPSLLMLWILVSPGHYSSHGIDCVR